METSIGGGGWSESRDAAEAVGVIGEGVSAVPLATSWKEGLNLTSLILDDSLQWFYDNFHPIRYMQRLSAYNPS